MAGGHDAEDIIDGGAGNDVIAGDNASILRRGDSLSPRFRVLTGNEIYDNDGNPQVTGDPQADPTGTAGRDVVIFDHSNNPASDTFADDYIAGGADDDTIFAQLGDDTIQGDGSIAEFVSAARVAGTLSVDPSFESISDGDDYIEGNGGNDTIFGNLGQDDIIGGSSGLFGLTDPGQRPDGADMIFGGAGMDIDRNDLGDESDTGHACDADIILADNGNIFRLVGTNGTNSGNLLTFNYDNYTEEGELKIVPRAAELLDYTPGGPGSNDIGAADEAHGESGDDFIYGMVGDDVLFGEGQDDDLIGGYGHDWFSGGAGDDGAVGDDGRVFTSRNGLAEPLYGVTAIANDLDKIIRTPGKIQTAQINVTDQLKKSVDLNAFDKGGNDIIYGGLGNDFLHGGEGDDAMSGAEALEDLYSIPDNPSDVLAYNPDTGEFAAYDEYDPRSKIDGFLLNFEAFTDANDQAGTWVDDGMDVLFGDRGNDWLVGGTNADNLYGGRGNDLLNLDDNLETNSGANDEPDPVPFAGGNGSDYLTDRAYGGAGRDVLIANSGADRLIDWVGEFNSYIVPFAPFGAFHISRTLQPQLAEFLYDLSKSDGADQTTPDYVQYVADLAADNSIDEPDPDRNFEPYGELGMIRQQDYGWHDQTGAPADPQAGNIPGGKRDVMRAEDFEDSTTTAFAVEKGTWSVTGGRYEAFSGIGEEAVSLFHVDAWLPDYTEILATVNMDKDKAGYESNAFIVFDFQSDTDFKFAGVDAGLNKLRIGHRTAEGWHVQSNMQLRDGTDYDLTVALNGMNVTLVVDGIESMTYTFTDPLNDGMIGVATDSAVSRFDNVVVQKLEPGVAFEITEDFSDGSADLFTSQTGGWLVNAGNRYEGTPAVDSDYAVTTLLLDVAPDSHLEFDATVNTGAMGGLVFDYYSPTNFKFAGVQTDTDQVVIGHYTPNGWFIDAAAGQTIDAGTDYSLAISLQGTTVSLSMDGQVVLGHAFNGLLNDGDLGLLSRDGACIFDDVAAKGDDTAYQSGQALTASGGVANSASQAGSLTQTDLAPIIDEAVSRWSESLLVDDAMLNELNNVSFIIADLSGAALGMALDDTVYIDINAAGYDWFVDSTPEDDLEFTLQNEEGELIADSASEAYGDMDLLTVVMHELGHVVGLEDLDPDTHDLMSETLDTGVRQLADDYVDEVNEAEDLAGLVVMDAAINEAEAVAAPATVSATKHGSSWLTEFLTNGAGKRYNQFDPKDDIKIVVFDDDEEND